MACEVMGLMAEVVVVAGETIPGQDSGVCPIMIHALFKTSQTSRQKKQRRFSHQVMIGPLSPPLRYENLSNQLLEKLV